jgi:hypothetical protein
VLPRFKLPRLFAFAAVAAGFGSLLAGHRCAAVEPAAVRPPGTAKQIGPLTELEPVLERALAAYNAGNERAFLAEFASAAPGIRAEGAYRRLFEGVYKVDYGKFEGKRLDSKVSVPDRDWGALIYDAAFQKRPKARLIANFIRENGAVKLMQIRFDYNEASK